MNIQQYETKDGSKRYILKGAYLGVDSLTGEQVRTTVRGKTEREVRRKYELKIREFEGGGSTKKKDTKIKTVDDLIDTWLVTYKDTVREITYMQNIKVLDKYVRPLIGDCKLDKLSPSLMQTKINQFLKEVTGKRQTYKFILSMIKRILKYGVALDLLTFNPMDKVIVQPVKSTIHKEKQIKYYEKDQVNQILIELDRLLAGGAWGDTVYATYIKLLLFTGARASEILALEWADIDFTNQNMRINKTLSNNGKNVELPKTKGSIRTIEIDSGTIKTLKQWRKIQLTKCWELGINQQPKIIFYNISKHDYYHYKNMLRIHIEFCENTNIPYLGGLHCFRHTHATMYINAGVDYKMLQERLGHEDISMTMNVYARALSENKKSALDNVVAFMKEA